MTPMPAADQEDLRGAGARDRPGACSPGMRPGDGDVEEPGRGKGQRVRQRAERLPQREVGDDGAQRPRPGRWRGSAPAPAAATSRRAPGCAKVPDAVRDLVRGHGEGGDEAERGVLEEGGRDQHAVEGVVQAVTAQHEDTGGAVAAVVVPMAVGVVRGPARPCASSASCCATTARASRSRRRPRARAAARRPDRGRPRSRPPAIASGRSARQRRAEQRPGGEAQEVRQQPRAARRSGTHSKRDREQRRSRCRRVRRTG